MRTVVTIRLYPDSPDRTRPIRLIVPKLRKENLLTLPSAPVAIELPQVEFRPVSPRPPDPSEEDEDLDDATFFRRHAEMEANERLRFIAVMKSCASHSKHRHRVLPQSYYTNTEPEDLLPTYVSVPALRRPRLYTERFPPPGEPPAVYPPKPPALVDRVRAAPGDEPFTVRFRRQPINSDELPPGTQ